MQAAFHTFCNSRAAFRFKSSNFPHNLSFVSIKLFISCIAPKKMSLLEHVTDTTNKNKLKEILILTFIHLEVTQQP